MSWKWMLIAMGMGLSLSQPSWARSRGYRGLHLRRHTRSVASAPLNCQIIIDTVSTAGHSDRVAFSTHLRTLRECRMLASLHGKNFEPNRIAHKKVRYRWLERATRLARR